MLVAVSISGLVIRHAMRTDLVEVKKFIMGAVTFMPVADLPGNWVFLMHFILVLVLVPLLPLHIFTAPFTLLEARRREEERPLYED
jgi:hypothetical protein